MLDERLREHLDGIAPPLTLDEIADRMHASGSADGAEPDAPSPTIWDDDLILDEISNDLGKQNRSRALVLAVAAVFGLIVAGLIVSNLSNDDLSVATDNRGEAAPEFPSLPQFPSLPGDFSTARWREIPMPFNALRGEADVKINDIATSSDGVAWAVGEETAFESDTIAGALSQPAIWRSAGGEEWEPVDLGLDPLQSVQDDTFDVSMFTHVVTTDDGAVWAFGNRLSLSVGADGGPEAGTGSFAPLGYRTVDGESWTALEVPGVGEDPAGVSSVSASGNDVVVTVETTDMFAEGDVANEQSASFVSADGLSWNQVGEPSPLGDNQLVLLDDGSPVSVFDSDFPGETPRVYQLVAGPDFFIASGIESEALSNAADESEAAAAQRVWFSADTEAWQVLDVQLPIGSLGSGAALFPYSGGMLSAATQTDGDGDGDDSNTLLVNIDASGFVEELAELPMQGVLDIFVVDGRLHLLDQPIAIEPGEAAASQSIWVAEFVTPGEAPASVSEAAADRADRMIGEDPFLGDPLVESFFASSPEAPAFLKVEPPLPLTAIGSLDLVGEGPAGVVLTYSDGEREARFCVLADRLKDDFSECDGLDLTYISGPDVSVFGAPTDSPDGEGFFDDWAFNPLLEE